MTQLGIYGPLGWGTCLVHVGLRFHLVRGYVGFRQWFPGLDQSPRQKSIFEIPIFRKKEVDGNLDIYFVNFVQLNKI